MALNGDTLRSEVLGLPEDDRVGLAVALLDSLSVGSSVDERADIDRVWAEETARRAAQIDDGTVSTYTWDDGFAKVSESRKAR